MAKYMAPTITHNGFTTRDAAARDRAWTHLLTHRGDTRTTTRRIIDRLSDWRDAITHYATYYLATIITTH